MREMERIGGMGGGGGGGGVKERICNIIINDRFYIALFSAREQTHCARMWFYMSE